MMNKMLRYKDLKLKMSGSSSNFDLGDLKNIGSSDLKVTSVCLGTATWGQTNTLDEAIEQLNIAVDEYGINFIDTAEMYPAPISAETQGEADRCLSVWLNRPGRDRSKLVLATKVTGYGGDRKQNNGSRIQYMPGRENRDCRVSGEDILTSVRFSLERLGTDYLDLLQIHWPDRYVPLWGERDYNPALEREEDISFQEQVLALEQLRREGKIRSYGLSNETPYGVMSFCHTAERLGVPKPVSVQNCYSLLHRCDVESGLVEACRPRHENLALLPYSPLAGGMLTGKYRHPDTCSSSRLNVFESRGFMTRYKQDRAQEAVALYCEVARKHGWSPAQLALAWLKSQPHVTSTIIGATNISQLRENIEVFDKSKQLTGEAREDIAEIYKTYRDPSSV